MGTIIKGITTRFDSDSYNGKLVSRMRTVEILQLLGFLVTDYIEILYMLIEDIEESGLIDSTIKESTKYITSLNENKLSDLMADSVLIKTIITELDTNRKVGVINYLELLARI